MEIFDGNTISEDEKRNSKWIDIVKGNNLFEEGHFHLSSYRENPSRMHGWINTNHLIQSYVLQEEIIRGFIEIIVKEKFIPEITIGVGLEGNILGCNLSTNDYLSNSDYSYIPLPEQNHTMYEERILIKKIIEKNNKEKRELPSLYIGYQKLLVIINVIHNGEMIIKKISQMLENYGFAGIDEVMVLSIFNVNNKRNIFETVNNLLIIQNELSPRKEINLRHKYLCHFPIPTCPYNENDYKDCVLYSRNIVKINQY